MKKLICGICFLLMLLSAGVSGAAAACCTAPDNGTGTVDFPPADCIYETPDDDMRIIDGLPAGTTIEMDATNDNFVCDVNNVNSVCSFQQGTSCRMAGGSLGGEKECFSSMLHLPMVGTGALTGFNRSINLQVSCETHIGPRSPGDPVQSFDTDMFRMFGQIVGDPDFDLLRIVAGTDFGLPSPGHTTLTQQPGGNWAVDSFFDITYRIDFVGAPGGPLAGRSGSTTGTIRIVTCQGQDVKWVQPPDKTRNGIDIRIDRHDQIPRIMADDFLCTQTGPITDVHFWGSWKGDPTPRGYIYRIHLSIHKDIPADPTNPDSYSMPGELLWEKDFNQNEFTETLVADLTPEYEWWWDVYNTAPAIPNGDQKIYRYDIDINPSDAFVQEGNPSDPQIYWLDIYVMTEFGEFGWKTSSQHWNDDAVFGYDQFGTPPAWMELVYPDIHPYRGKSIDMAFAITTKPVTEPTEGCCFPDGSCADLTQAECIDKNGTPQGIGTNCATTQCPVPEPTQACCLSDGNCAGLTLAECKARGGTPQGVGTDCVGVNCPVPCEIPPMNCPVSGEPAVIMTYLGGLNDNFTPLPDAPFPDATLLSYITTCSAPGTLLQFDQVPGEGMVPANSWLGHTFTGLPFGIVAAKLQIRARATTGSGSGGTYNDAIAIVSSISGCTPTYAWANRFMNLPEAGGTWSPGQVDTFCLDLSALPTTTGTVSVLSQLASGNLRIFVPDDTGVDYIKLTIAVCPCKYRFRQEVTAGVDDNCKFTLPTEPASPSPALVTAFPGPWRQFDEIIWNKKFGHTFTGLPSGIVAAQLEMCLRAGQDFSANDALHLQFLNPTFAWGKGIASLTAMPWNVGDQKKLVLDLGSLPPSIAGVTSILGTLASGKLDVYIQDDTAVDYITLRYWTCCKKSMSGDINLDGTVNFKDLAILAEDWLEVDPCPSCP